MEYVFDLSEWFDGNNPTLEAVTRDADGCIYEYSLYDDSDRRHVVVTMDDGVIEPEDIAEVIMTHANEKFFFTMKDSPNETVFCFLWIAWHMVYPKYDDQQELQQIISEMPGGERRAFANEIIERCVL